MIKSLGKKVWWSKLKKLTVYGEMWDMLQWHGVKYIILFENKFKTNI
jgi:hypothetical protein